MSRSVNKAEAPAGFYAVSKSEAGTLNVCDSCDARKLCQANVDDWCLENRCMSHGVIAFKDGKTYERKDGQSVYFKREPHQPNISSAGVVVGSLTEQSKHGVNQSLWKRLAEIFAQMMGSRWWNFWK